MSDTQDIEQKQSRADTAVELTAEASSAVIENTANFFINLMDKLVSFFPWLVHWHVKILVVIAIALIINFGKRYIVKAFSWLVTRTTGVTVEKRILRSLYRPIAGLIFIVAFETCLLILGQAFGWSITDQTDTISSAMLVIIVSMLLLGIVNNAEHTIIQSRVKRGRPRNATGVDAISKLIRLIIYVITGMVLLGIFGVSVRGLLAFGGIGGMVVGFAAKDMLANFFGAIMVYWDRPFRVGDWIRSPDREIEGTVEDIGWRITRIRTFDKRPLYVPNSTFSTIAIENPSRMLNRRIKENIGVRYDDIDQIEAIVADIKSMLLAHNEIDQNNTLIVNLNAFSASSVDIMLYTFTMTTDWTHYHRIKQDVLLKVAEIIKQHDAEIAFPTSTMYIKRQVPEAQGSPAERS